MYEEYYINQIPRIFVSLYYIDWLLVCQVKITRFQTIPPPIGSM